MQAMPKVPSTNLKMSMFLSRTLNSPAILFCMQPSSLSGDGRYYWNTKLTIQRRTKASKDLLGKASPENQQKVAIEMDWKLTISLPRRNRLCQRFQIHPAMK